jgi:hypothetical protein
MHHLKSFIAVGLVSVMGFSIATLAANYMGDGREAGAGNPSASYAVISPNGHQEIKASVINDDPSSYKIDVKKLANMGVNEEAPTFAVYTKSSLPSQCGDFRNLELPYKKPTKYEREFNLSGHPEVLNALDSYGCVVMRNIPPNG